MIEGWVIAELLGHRQVAGLLSEETIAGVGFLRIDVPQEDGTFKVSYYATAAVYAIHPATEERVRKLNIPMIRLALPAPEPDFAVNEWDEDDDRDPDNPWHEPEESEDGIRVLREDVNEQEVA